MHFLLGRSKNGKEKLQFQPTQIYCMLYATKFSVAKNIRERERERVTKKQNSLLDSQRHV